MPKQFNVGVRGVIRKDNDLLFLKLPLQDGRLSWDFPGGRTEDKETIQEALLRETSEELPGLTNIVVNTLLHADRAEKDFDDGTGLVWLFYAMSADIEQLHQQPDHKGHKWMNRQEIEEMYVQTDIRFHPAFYAAAIAALE